MLRNLKLFLLVMLVTVGATISGVGQSQGPRPAPAKTAKLSGKTDEVRTLLDEAKSAALRIENDFQRGLVLDHIGEAQAKNGDLDAAAETANRAYPHTMATLTAIGTELGNSNNLVKAKALRSKLKAGGSSTVFYFIAKQQAGNGRFDEALQTTELIQAPEVRKGALEAIGEQQAATGHYVAARKTFALAAAGHPAERSTSDNVEIILVATQLSRGDTETARQTIGAMKSPQIRFSMMISGAEALLRMKDQPGATAWLKDALRQLPAEPDYDFARYLAIPAQVKILGKDVALQAAGNLPPNLRAKGHLAIAVVCAETKDIDCVNTTLEKMQKTASAESDDADVSDFTLRLNILNVTAALIDHNEFAAARRWLATVDQPVDDVSFKMGIEPNIQLQRVVMLAQEGAFESARSLALQMRLNSVSNVERGTAWRTIAVLDVRKNGIASTKAWASTLADFEDRTYALLGIAQSLLGLDDIKLPYGVIQIH